MDLSKILAISGKPGLFEILSQTKNGIIVEALEDGKKIPVFINDRSSTLEDISVFTETEDLPLKDVFKKIFEKENGAKSIDAKADKNEMIKYFESVLPDYDKDRVYASDIKKIIAWYNLLVEKKKMEFKEELEEKPKDEQADNKEGKKPEPEAKSKAKPSGPKVTAVKTKAQKVQPAKGSNTKNKGIGIKQK